MNLFRSTLFITTLCLFNATNASAQLKRNVLFLGNSYTGFNNLPQLIHDMASSAGDTLTFDSNTPGGYRLIDHNGNALSQNKINSGGWDYVVLQGQSRESILNPSEFASGATRLNDSITQHTPCSVVLFYMTWGRKNGDPTYCPSFPVMCTYQGMDTTIRNNYIHVAKNMKAEVAPVSVVWNYLRQHHPGIELYNPDESHPSVKGSYAAACSFYTMIFKKDPTNITFNSTLNATEATAIKNATKTLVFNQLNTWDYKQPPVSEFSYTIGPGVNEVFFNAKATAETLLWDFGDGTTSTLLNPTHAYAADGTYKVSLTTTFCDLQGLHSSTTDTVIQFCSHTPTVFTKNPWLCNYDTLWTQPADKQQWFSSGSPIPETNLYLANYAQYNNSTFSVLSTLGGCSELSQPFHGSPQWAGYYFDASTGGDPCEGDTVPFAVLHINGSLTGNELILWYQNGALLNHMTNKDTLLVTEGGTYVCKVIDPNSNCPLDTTTTQIVFDCGTVGIAQNQTANSWKIYPNPANTTATIEFNANHQGRIITVYSMAGQLMHRERVRATLHLPIAHWPIGMYVVKLENEQRIFKLIKQ